MSETINVLKIMSNLIHDSNLIQHTVVLHRVPLYLLMNLRSHAEEFARIVDYHAFARTATCRWTDLFHSAI